MNTTTQKIATIQDITARITKKHPIHYHLSVKESTHCVLGHVIDAFIELEDEKLMYSTDSAYRLRIVRREKLTSTYKSVRLQPHDSVVVIRGGKYDGHYIVRTECDGWLKTTTDINEVKPMRNYYAEQVRNYISFHAQYCYRGTFEVVTLPLTNTITL